MISEENGHSSFKHFLENLFDVYTLDGGEGLPYCHVFMFYSKKENVCYLDVDVVDLTNF